MALRCEPARNETQTQTKEKRAAVATGSDADGGEVRNQPCTTPSVGDSLQFSPRPRRRVSLQNGRVDVYSGCNWDTWGWGTGVGEGGSSRLPRRLQSRL